MKTSIETKFFAGFGLSICIICLCLSVCQSSTAQAYAIGADLSFLKQAEDNGFAFKEEGKEKPGLQIFKDHGYNWIRLRVFHTPDRLPNDLEYTISLAREAKEMGYYFLLDYHYSDTWADPGKQYMPKAWEGKSQDELVEEVYKYTRSTMIAFREAGAFPDMVQVGNEINNGMIWPNGKLPDNWDNFAELLQAGINGVYASCGNNPCPSIMIHIAKGGDKDFTEYYFDKIKSYEIEYDVIGQSYYPWWHGSLLDLRECLNFAARAYEKDVIVVEAAYNFTPREYVDELAPYPETPEGQREFLDEVNRIVLAVPDNRGCGVFWWEPAAPGRGFSSRTYFDEEGNVQPVIQVFDKYTRK
jgi:arabinogalactan endo-1,4-beta-galactosidase